MLIDFGNEGREMTDEQKEKIEELRKEFKEYGGLNVPKGMDYQQAGRFINGKKELLKRLDDEFEIPF